MTALRVFPTIIVLVLSTALVSAKLTGSSSGSSGYSCGWSCSRDSDCYQGGFVQCGVCNKVRGTRSYGTCVERSRPQPPTPAPSPEHNYFPQGGQCKRHCTRDSDCQVGGFNPCGSCGQYQGTQMYHLCYQPEDSPPSPPQTPTCSCGQCKSQLRDAQQSWDRRTCIQDLTDSTSGVCSLDPEVGHLCNKVINKSESVEQACQEAGFC